MRGERSARDGDENEDGVGAGAEVRGALFTHQSAFPFPLTRFLPSLSYALRRAAAVAAPSNCNIRDSATATSTSAAPAIDI